MKMSNDLFWGIVLIVIGLSIILKFAFDISIVRIVLSVAFILIGIKILIGKPVIRHNGSENQVIFGERNYSSSPVHGAEYNTVFGKGVYDFREIKDLPERRTKVKFNTIFASSEIILPPDLPVRIKSDAVFGTAAMPNGNTVSFGSINFENRAENVDTSMLVIDVSVVFGSMIIRQ
jgi:hypothetical protein